MTRSTLGFPAVWLRHNCPCAECLDPVTGQRLIEVTAIPNGCGVTVEAETAESVTVVFAPDGHRAVFRRAWLADCALPAGDPAPARRSPWLAGLAGVPERPAAPGSAAGGSSWPARGGGRGGGHWRGPAHGRRQAAVAGGGPSGRAGRRPGTGPVSRG